MYVITGATGNIGRRVAESLLSKGKKVKVVGRSKERLKPLVDQGAKPHVGSVEDVASMTEAYKDATAVFNMIPPNLEASDFRAYQNKVSEALATAIIKSGVQYVVNLSSIGAHLSEKVGPINGLHDNEERLKKLKNVHVIHLRPAYFMENLLWNMDMIKQMGINGSPLRGDVAFSMIATRDIAEAVIPLLINLSFSGKSTKELLGQRDLSMVEVTKIIGKAVGKPDLKYVQFPYEDAEKAMIGMGLSPDVARLLIELNRGINEGILIPTEKRSKVNTTPTSFEEFVKFFAEIYD